MGRFLKKLIFIGVTVLVLLLALNFLILPQVVTREIEKQLRDPSLRESGLKVSVKKIFVTSVFPMQIRIDGLAILTERLPLTLKIQEIQFYSGWGPDWYKPNLKWNTRLRITRPELNFVLNAESTPATDPPSNPPVHKDSEGPSWLKWIEMYPYGGRVGLEVDQGQATLSYEQKGGVDSSSSEAKAQEGLLKQIRFKNLSFTLEKLNDIFDIQQPILTKMTGDLEVYLQAWKIELPFQLSESPLFFTHEFMSSPDLDLKVAGLDSSIRGKSEWMGGEHQWNLNLNIPHIEKLPIPPQFLPPGQWFGGLKGQALIEKKANESLRIKSGIQTKEFRGNIDLVKDEFSVKGNLFANINLDLLFEKEKLTVPRIEISSNWDNVSLNYKDLLQKPVGDKLGFYFDGYFSKDFLVIKNAEWNLANLTAQLSGFLSPFAGKNGKLELKVPSTNLKSLGQLIPMVSKYPVSGQLLVSANLMGDFVGAPQQVSVNANPIRLNNLKMTFNHRDDKNKIYLIGPVSADIGAVLKTQGQKIESGTVRSQADLSGMEIRYKDLFKKPMGKSFRLNLAAGAEGENLVFKNSYLDISGGKIRIDGHLSKPQQPRMKLQLKTEKLAIEDLSLITPLISEYKARGIVNSNFSIHGLYDFEKGSESPFYVNGSADIHLTNVSYVSSPTNGGSELPPIQVEPSDQKALLPNWPLFAKSEVQISAKVKQGQFQKLQFRNASLKVNYSKGGVSAAGIVGRIFSGKIYIDRMRGQLLAAQASYDGKIRFVANNLQEILGFVTPKYSEDVKGHLSGVVNFKSPWPGSKDWINGLQSQGSIELKALELSSLKLDEAVNKALAKIPKAKIEPVKTEGFKGELQSIYVLKNKNIDFSKLFLKSEKNDELHLRGQIGWNQNMNLTGQLSLAKPPLRGEVYLCNKDDQGRFILPIRLNGQWTNPSLSFASATVEKLLANTLKCSVKKARAQANQKLESEIKKATKDLEKDLEKNLKDLFE